MEQNKAVSVTQDNQIIEACYSMTLLEKRLLYLAIAQINPTDFIRSGEALTATVNASEYSDNFDGDNPYLSIKRASKKLLKRQVEFHPRVGKTESVQWFDKVTYDDGGGRITIVFGRSIAVWLTGLHEKFTRIDLLSISQIDSIHSIRLYELLMQYQSTGYRVIKVEDFRFAMDCKDKYKKTKDLKRAILNKAIKELNEKTDLKIRVSDQTQGKKIIAFKFVFSR